MRLILLPQAIRAMLPVIISQLVVTLKDTALGFIITYPELLYFARTLGSNAPLGSPLIPAALVAGTIYVALCMALSYTAYVVERRLRRSPKLIAGPAPANAPTPATETIAAQEAVRRIERDDAGGS
jgi:glutamate transport system permease protein